MKIKLPLIIVSIILLSTLTKPDAVSSQQQKAVCSIDELNQKTPLPPMAEFCACEQALARDKPTYAMGNSPFGRATVARKTTRRRNGIGVAASPGAIERVEHSALLGDLDVPNADDLSSPEVAGLQKQLFDYREKRRQATEAEWLRFQKYRLRGRTPEEALQKTINEIARRHLAEDILLYKQFKDLQNTSGWENSAQFDWRARA